MSIYPVASSMAYLNRPNVDFWNETSNVAQKSLAIYRKKKKTSGSPF